MTETETRTERFDPEKDPSSAVAWLLATVRASSADTGDAATQHALDAALVALERTLSWLAGAGAQGGVA